MPLYDYICDQCGHRFEVRQGIKEDALTECPQCGGLIRRVIHPVGIVFKGSGFYVTDSRKAASASTPSSNGASTEKKEAAPATESTGASSGATESKPAAASAGSASSSASSGATSNSGSSSNSGGSAT